MYSVGLTAKDVQMNLAAQVKILRKQMGFTQADLSARAQVSLGSYKRFESTGLIASDALIRIAFILGKLETLATVFEYRQQPDFNKLFKGS
jgi:transcriptional regulator with XRE-family HTH domain